MKSRSSSDMMGVDISDNNGTVDFTALKNDGVEVVMIKATEGITYVNPLFETYFIRA